jgi:hypothetical protein
MHPIVLEALMLSRIAGHLRANVVGYLALFAALGGTSYAAVRLAPGSVTTSALAKGAVTHSKLAPGSVGASDIAKRSLSAAVFKPGALLTAVKATAGAKGGSGTAGANGAAGLAGAAGTSGAPGPAGPAGADGSASVVMKARDTGTVTAPDGASTNVPLSGGTWTQGASDVNLITGSVQLGIPATCTGSFGNALSIYVDGVANTFALAPTAPASTTVTMPFLVSELMEPGASTQHTITAKLGNSCTKSGEDYTVSNVKVDVVTFH